MVICILLIIACIEHPAGMLRSVDNNDATTPRIPLGMRPIGGCIPTACKEWRIGIFLPSDASLTGCCNSDVIFRLPMTKLDKRLICMVICILRIIACIEHPAGMLRSVDNNDATTPRIPLGMRPIGGYIPTACKEWESGIFLPSDASLTGCCNSDVIFRLFEVIIGVYQ